MFRKYLCNHRRLPPLDFRSLYQVVTNIVDDLKSVSEDPQFQKLRTLPKCALSHWIVHWTPLTLDEPDLGTVVDGMIDVFPSLEYCQGLDDVWGDISSRITDLRGI